MRPAIVSTAVASPHKDSPLQRHGCAFVLPHTLSVPHSGGLERHHRVPIKPLGEEDSPDRLIHNTYRHIHIQIRRSFQNLQMYCKYRDEALRSIVHLPLIYSLNGRIMCHFQLLIDSLIQLGSLVNCHVKLIYRRTYIIYIKALINGNFYPK